MGLSRTASLLLTLGILVGIYNGHVAIWKDEDPEPYRVFPYYAASLPKDIRDALEKGVHFNSEDELNALLENLLS